MGQVTERVIWMNELKCTSKLVKQILETDPQTRNSDCILYFKVLHVISTRNGIRLQEMTVPDFLLNMKSYGFPGFETVRRARQKIQATYPGLAASKKISEMRMINETEFRVFARGDV